MACALDETASLVRAALGGEVLFPLMTRAHWNGLTVDLGQACIRSSLKSCSGVRITGELSVWIRSHDREMSHV